MEELENRLKEIKKQLKKLNERELKTFARLFEDCGDDSTARVQEGANGQGHILKNVLMLFAYIESMNSLYVTPGAKEALQEARRQTKNQKTEPAETAEELFNRHQAGDWGDLTEEEKEENELSIKEGFRVLSAYKLKATGQTLWVITEADRSKTTILRPDEY